MKKYYFITYQGVRRDTDPSIDIWHEAISESPMSFRDRLIASEEKAQYSSYNDFIILNTCEITKEEYHQ